MNDQCDFPFRVIFGAGERDLREMIPSLFLSFFSATLQTRRKIIDGGIKCHDERKKTNNAIYYHGVIDIIPKSLIMLPLDIL